MKRNLKKKGIGTQMILSFILNTVLFVILLKMAFNPYRGLDLQLANFISWFSTSIFVFAVSSFFSKKWQFQSFLYYGLSFLLDVILLYVFVTKLHFHYFTIKLVSQIFDFLFLSIVHLLNEKKKSDHFSLLYILGILPLLEIVNVFLVNRFFGLIFFLLYCFIFLYEILYFLKQKKYFSFIGITVFYFLIQISYFICKDVATLENVSFLIKIFLIPYSCLYFHSYSKEYKKDQIIVSYFYFLLFSYFLTFLLPLTRINELKTIFIPILVLFLPIVFEVLNRHHNFFTKTVGYLLLGIFLLTYRSIGVSILFLIAFLYSFWKDRKGITWKGITLIFLLFLIFSNGVGLFEIWQNKGDFETAFFGNRLQTLDDTKETYLASNLEEEIFGLAHVPTTFSIDFVSIFYQIGYVGMIVYLFSFSYVIYHLHMRGIYAFSFCLGIALSLLIGGVFTNPLGIFVGCLFLKKKGEKKRILLVSNMYPSKKYKHYGSFVKNTKESLENLHFEVDVVGKKKENFFLFKLFGYVFFYIRAFWKSMVESYDFIYVHFLSHSTFPVILGRLCSSSTLLVGNAHGNDILISTRESEKNRKRSSFALKFLDKVVVPSLYFKEVLQKEYHVSSDKIDIYPSAGVRTQLFQKMDQKKCQKNLGLEDGFLYFGFVSRIEHGKGWDTLLRSMAHLKKEKFYDKIKIVIVGSGSMQKELEACIHKYQLEEKIIQKDFVYQKDLVQYYNAFDVFVFPTKLKEESLGLVGLEAMACETFVIGRDLYGPREYLIHGENAFTFQKDDELEERIKEWFYLKDEKKRQMKKKAREKALEYDVEVIQDKLARIFNK